MSAAASTAASTRHHHPRRVFRDFVSGVSCGRRRAEFLAEALPAPPRTIQTWLVAEVCEERGEPGDSRMSETGVSEVDVRRHRKGLRSAGATELDEAPEAFRRRSLLRVDACSGADFSLRERLCWGPRSAEPRGAGGCGFDWSREGFDEMAARIASADILPGPYPAGSTRSSVVEAAWSNSTVSGLCATLIVGSSSALDSEPVSGRFTVSARSSVSSYPTSPRSDDSPLSRGVVGRTERRRAPRLRTSSRRATSGAGSACSLLSVIVRVI
jgi:hypothetical protein